VTAIARQEFVCRGNRDQLFVGRVIIDDPPSQSSYGSGIGRSGRSFVY
jgi:hypothetical protein